MCKYSKSYFIFGFSVAQTCWSKQYLHTSIWNGSCCRFEDKKHIIMWSDRFLLWIVEWSLWGGASAMHGCLSWELWQGKLELLVAEGLETHSDPCDIRCVAVMCARHLASKDFHRVFASRLSSLLKMLKGSHMLATLVWFQNIFLKDIPTVSNILQFHAHLCSYVWLVQRLIVLHLISHY